MKGDLKKGNVYAKELVEISETTGVLVAFGGLQSVSVALLLLVTAEAAERQVNGCLLLSSFRGLA